MSRQLALQTANSPQLRHRLLALAIALLIALPTGVEAKTEFKSLLDLQMTIPSGAIHNKFGFATSFPKPAAAPPFGIKNGNPGGDSATFTANGGTAGIGIVAERKDVAKGRGLKLTVAGDTNAIPVDGSIGQAEGWLSGTAKFRLGNITGRPGLPEVAQKVTVDLDVTTIYDLFASATNDINPADRANAKVVYSLTNTSTGDVLIPETVFTVDDDDTKAPERIGPVNNTTNLSLTIPANTFYNLELFGHVYAAGESRGAAPPNPPPVNRPAGSIPNLPKRMDETLPDEGMRLPASTTALFGDASGYGGGTLLASAGVIGEDPLARHRLNTVMLESAVTSGQHFYDLEVAVEVPVNDFSQVAIQDVMGAASGFHGQFYDLQLGTGVGGEFQLSEDPIMLSLAGVDSPFAPQDLTGAYQLMGFNDPFAPTQMVFQGQLQSGQMSQFEMVANLHDQVDGEIDGMARFTLRKLVQGFGGDYNNDFVTNGLDLALWQETYGTDDFLADGDANGRIDGRDFLNWQRNFGRGFGTFGPSAIVSGVPEPTTAALALASMLALVWGQRRGGKS